MESNESRVANTTFDYQTTIRISPEYRDIRLAEKRSTGEAAIVGREPSLEETTNEGGLPPFLVPAAMRVSPALSLAAA
jgi:hypothetical protein